MTVNWTPFLTLLPLRLPANDMMEREWSASWRDDLGDGDRLFRCGTRTQLGSQLAGHFKLRPAIGRLQGGLVPFRFGAHSWLLPFALLLLLSRVSAQMLSPSSSSIACCAKRAVYTHFKKNIKTRTLITEEGAQPLKKPKVTKRKYAELPTGRVLPDGTVSPPLGEWTGGLREPVVAHENSISSIRAHFHADQYISVLTPLPINRLRFVSGRHAFAGSATAIV